MTHANTYTQNTFSGVTERCLLLEIAYYEHMAAEAEHLAVSHRGELRDVYETLTRYRRALLDALRNGRPEAWTDYLNGYLAQ